MSSSRPLSSPEHKCSVFYGAPTKSKLLSTLCSADVCQCAEGETQGWEGGQGAGEARACAVSPGPLMQGSAPGSVVPWSGGCRTRPATG